MKTIALLLTSLLLAIPAHAGNKNNKADYREKIREAKAKDREAIKAFMEPIDKNRDGSLSKAEFIADEDDKEAAVERFDEANKNGDRSLSKSEISDMLGLGQEVEKLKQQEKDKKKKK